MKFFWKIFFVFTAMITAVFSVFGIWMITQSFRNSLKKEIEEGNRESRLFQFAFEVNMNSLSENYQTEKVVKELTESVVANLDGQSYTYRLYRGRQNVIYENTELRLEHGMMRQMGEDTCVYQVLESGQSRYLIFLCKSVMGGRTYYLESTKDITELYEERDHFYDQYRIIMLALIAASGFIVLLLSHFLTKSVVALSGTTRQFAEGAYEVRSDVVSGDEIGTLAQDFNRMADNLVEKMKELTDAARKQEDFTASFAHELKTPLTSIIGYADMLRTMDMTKEEITEAANYIYSQGKRLESLSFKLLELIVTGKQDYRFRKVEVSALVQEAVRITQKSLEEKKLACEVKTAPGFLWGERDLLISLLVNLIDNARKALPEGGHIRIAGTAQKQQYVLSVQDDGCGMPKTEINKITEAFYMVDKSRSRREGGAGLGMTLCSRIVELHGAEWKIESNEGEGTCITLRFHTREVPELEEK